MCMQVKLNIMIILLEGIRCVGGLPYTTHFQIYVVFEVLVVVMEVYHLHNTLSNIYVVLEVKHVVLAHFRHICFSTIVLNYHN